MMYYYYIPQGFLTIEASNIGITSITIIYETNITKQNMTITNPIIKECVNELDLYFSGNLTNFKTPVDLSAGTKFQQAIWHTLQTIPYGKHTYYQDIAKLINNPKAAQAVGQACKKNPIPIIVPCHRVIGKNGNLTGYQGKSSNGLDFKEYLLSHEIKKALTKD